MLEPDVAHHHGARRRPPVPDHVLGRQARVERGACTATGVPRRSTTHRDPVDHRSGAWIILEDVVLALQLGRVGPAVVALAEGEHIGARGQTGEPAVQALDRDDAARVEGKLGERPVPQEQADPVGVGVGVGDAELAGAVVAAVLADDHLEREVCLLGKDAVEALGDERRRAGT